MILNSRYPTEKAYGVTTSLTAEALKDQGHLVEIWAPSAEANQEVPHLTKNLVSKRNRVIIQFVNTISEKIGLTRERVRQIKEKALRRLRKSSKSKILKSYLG